MFKKKGGGGRGGGRLLYNQLLQYGCECKQCDLFSVVYEMPERVIGMVGLELRDGRWERVVGRWRGRAMYPGWVPETRAAFTGLRLG